MKICNSKAVFLCTAIVLITAPLSASAKSDKLERERELAGKLAMIQLLAIQQEEKPTPNPERRSADLSVLTSGHD